jgi:hypothetical protein
LDKFLHCYFHLLTGLIYCLPFHRLASPNGKIDATPLNNKSVHPSHLPQPSHHKHINFNLENKVLNQKRELRLNSDSKHEHFTHNLFNN